MTDRERWLVISGWPVDFLRFSAKAKIKKPLTFVDVREPEDLTGERPAGIVLVGDYKRNPAYNSDQYRVWKAAGVKIVRR
jgi:hypothetical protein